MPWGQEIRNSLEACAIYTSTVRWVAICLAVGFVAEKMVKIKKGATLLNPQAVGPQQLQSPLIRRQAVLVWSTTVTQEQGHAGILPMSIYKEIQQLELSELAKIACLSMERAQAESQGSMETTG